LGGGPGERLIAPNPQAHDVPEATRSLSFWHRRYQLQAEWTAPLRAHAYALSGLQGASRVLEIGSGTGVISADLRAHTRGSVFGVELDPATARFAAQAAPGLFYSAGDGARLPYASSTFDVVATHFLLLWVRDAAAVLREAVRVIRPGGWLLCLAEPDYGGRVDYPETLANLGRLQTYALQSQGANPHVGRTIRGLLVQAGLAEVTAGVMASEWRAGPDEAALRSEVDTMEADLQGLASADEMENWRTTNERAWREGSRVLFVPTFYALGRKPLR
jgi:SAM-dependent methyltransferase